MKVFLYMRSSIARSNNERFPAKPGEEALSMPRHRPSAGARELNKPERRAVTGLVEGREPTDVCIDRPNRPVGSNYPVCLE